MFSIEDTNTTGYSNQKRPGLLADELFKTKVREWFDVQRRDFHLLKIGYFLLQWCSSGEFLCPSKYHVNGVQPRHGWGVAPWLHILIFDIFPNEHSPIFNILPYPSTHPVAVRFEASMDESEMQISPDNNVPFPQGGSWDEGKHLSQFCNHNLCPLYRIFEKFFHIQLEAGNAL